MTTEALLAESRYKAAYYAHSANRIKFRAGELSAEDFCASNGILIEARKRHETFLFGGTDNECHY